MVPAIMYGLARLGRMTLRRRLGVEGLLAHANLTSAIPRLSISVAALSVSLAMMVAIAVMIGSFRDTVVYWVGQTLKADLFIGPGIRPTVGSEQTVSEDVIATLGHASRRRRRSIGSATSTWSYEGNLAVLGAGSFDVVLEHGGLLFKSPANARDEVRQAIGQDTVIISEPFATRYQQARRRHPCRSRRRRACCRSAIAAIYYDYASDRGVVDHGSRHLPQVLRRAAADRRRGLPEARRGSGDGAQRDARHAGRGPSRLHLQQPDAAQRDPARSSTARSRSPTRWS